MSSIKMQVLLGLRCRTILLPKTPTSPMTSPSPRRVPHTLPSLTRLGQAGPSAAGPLTLVSAASSLPQHAPHPQRPAPETIHANSHTASLVDLRPLRPCCTCMASSTSSSRASRSASGNNGDVPGPNVDFEEKSHTVHPELEEGAVGSIVVMPLPSILDPMTGEELEGNNVEGMLALKMPWPSIMCTIWKDHMCYLETYMKPYLGLFYTGDGAVHNEDGFDQFFGPLALDSGDRESVPIMHKGVVETVGASPSSFSDWFFFPQPGRGRFQERRGSCHLSHIPFGDYAKQNVAVADLWLNSYCFLYLEPRRSSVLQSAMGSYTALLTAMNRYQLLRGWYQLLPAATQLYKPLQTATNFYKPLQTACSCYQLLPAATSCLCCSMNSYEPLGTATLLLPAATWLLPEPATSCYAVATRLCYPAASSQLPAATSCYRIAME
ncbi:hypothetical protein B0H17DRAFT_1128305 [Mycena rosella]|uniref:Uncharacterized protein n=1 Tax=Mycena rosella TaxID=1033263 RepID=A0AAD7GME3_MYCRO|nr:hypothetical protein B0H17DRAFT_1128305 [Mycena rosella]